MKTLGILVFILPYIWATPTQIKSIGARIIGGTPANAAQFPFVAAIYKTTQQGTFFCSGTLLNTQWVLTAAQCVHDGVTFQVRLGAHTLQSTDPNRLIISTSIYYHHELFDLDTLTNDIGLIKFHLPISLTDYIRPVDFLGGNALNETIPVLTLGWGQTSDHISGLSDSLNYVQLSTLSNDECRLLFGPQIADHMVCVAGNFNEGVCNGDSGGPLILYTVTNRPIQVGISSFISGNGCESTDPSGFTRIEPYVEWITNILVANTA